MVVFGQVGIVNKNSTLFYLVERTSLSPFSQRGWTQPPWRLLHSAKSNRSLLPDRCSSPLYQRSVFLSLIICAWNIKTKIKLYWNWFPIQVILRTFHSSAIVSWNIFFQDPSRSIITACGVVHVFKTGCLDGPLGGKKKQRECFIKIQTLIMCNGLWLHLPNFLQYLTFLFDFLLVLLWRNMEGDNGWLDGEMVVYRDDSEEVKQFHRRQN